MATINMFIWGIIFDIKPIRTSDTNITQKTGKIMLIAIKNICPLKCRMFSTTPPVKTKSRPGGKAV